MTPTKDFKYDRTQFFDVLKGLQKYQVGSRFWYMRDRKIIEGAVYEVNLRVYDHGMTHTTTNQLTIVFNILMLSGYSAHPINVSPDNLFDSREEAAEKFLQDNDVPSELLRVLKNLKPKTTVANLIEKLHEVDPNIDLASTYAPVLKRISDVYLRGNTTEKTTPDYWDCECEFNYIHDKETPKCIKCGATKEDSPDSRVNEVESGEHFFKIWAEVNR